MGFFGKLPKLGKLPKPNIKKKAGQIKEIIDNAEEPQDDLERVGDSNFFTTPLTDRPPNMTLSPILL